MCPRSLRRPSERVSTEGLGLGAAACVRPPALSARGEVGDSVCMRVRVLCHLYTLRMCFRSCKCVMKLLPFQLSAALLSKCLTCSTEQRMYRGALHAQVLAMCMWGRGMDVRCRAAKRCQKSYAFAPEKHASLHAGSLCGCRPSVCLPCGTSIAAYTANVNIHTGLMYRQVCFFWHVCSVVLLAHGCVMWLWQPQEHRCSVEVGPLHRSGMVRRRENDDVPAETPIGMQADGTAAGPMKWLGVS